MVRRRHVVAVVLLACSVGLASAAPPHTVLVVEETETGDRLLTTPVHDGSTVTLAYTHSVEQTPVEDVYTVDGTRLDNTRMRFKSYGWGLPARANVTLDDGWFVYDPDRSYDELYVAPGPIAGHTLTVDGETYDLVDRSNASTVRITVLRRGPIATLQRYL